MFIAKKAAAMLAAALFCLASPVDASDFATKNALVKKLKAAGVNKGAMWPKGAVFSFVDYDEIPFGPSGVGKFSIMATSTETDPTTGVPDFKYAMYEKPIYAAETGTTVLGNALYNIQVFDETPGTASATGIAEGNYQNVQNIPLKNPNTGQNQEVFININGRVEWTLAKDTGSGSAYPTAVEGAKILSIAVSSLESGGVACTNVGITAITADPGVGRTEYIIDARKANCVKQTF